MSSNHIRIAVDAMGGDFAPHEIVKGAVLGARTHGVTVLLVGNEAVIREELASQDTQGLNIEVVPASEVIEMGESPATALRKKRDASIIVTAKCVANGDAQGMVAAGSTGAAMAAATLYIGRLKGIDRPAIGVMLPSLTTPCLMLDAGANADCIPEWLLQFARMGSIFMENVYNIPSPRVGLLNIGEESGKGNAFVNSAFELLKNDHTLNFLGNVEAKDMFRAGADVAVCDGFSGNVALKSAEGIATMLLKMIKQELGSNLLSQAGGFLAKKALMRVKKKVDPEEYGGALLLGIKGICIIGHGGSSALAINNAIRVAKEAIESDVLSKTESRILEGVASV